MSNTADSRSSAAVHTRLRRRIRHHYYRVMPDRAHHRAAIWSVFWIIAAILVVQIIYPLERTMPLAYLQGEHRGYESELRLAADITKAFDSTIIRLEAGEESVEVTLGSLGAEPDVSRVIAQLGDYPFWQRYVPLSLLWPRHAQSVPLVYTNAIAAPACQQHAAALSRDPVNANLSLRDGQLVASEDVDGLIVNPEGLCRQIHGLDISLGGTIELAVDSDQVSATKTSADFAAVAAQARQALDRELMLYIDEIIYSPDPGERAGWLQLDDENGQTILGVNQGAVRSYLEDINREAGQSPGRTNIRIVNGIETGRDEGEAGKAIDYDEIIEQLTRQLTGQVPVQPIRLTFVAVKPTIIYNNRYTASEDGLQAYVTDAAQQYAAHISIQQLDGPEWRAAAHEHDSIPSASTYKLYVAMRLFDEMKAGRVTWNGAMLDTSVSVCFDRMTIASTNACAEEWLNRWGRASMNQYVHTNGFSRGTTFISPIATHTTAADLTSYMARLARGELYDDIYRQRLYASIGNHPYPYGIPAGSAGRVYNKVGFLWDYVHDTAIVEHPSGSYVMTIMTKGQSYSRIASITREVERIMYGG